MGKMEKNLSNLFSALINTAPSPRLEEFSSSCFETDKYLAHAFFLLDRYQSPPLMERDDQIMTVQMGLLSLDTAPAPRLEDFPSAPSRVKPKKTRQNRNSSGHVKCPDCNMNFPSYVAMFSHIRIHQDEGCKGFKKPKPKARSASDLCNKLTASCTVTENQSPREVPERKTPEEVMSSILIDMSKSTWNSQGEKSRTVEFSPSEEDEEVAAILDDMPNLIWNCESEKRRMSQSARLENKKRRKNVTSGEVKDNSEWKAQACKIGAKSYPTGHQLGGHKQTQADSLPSGAS